MSNDNFIKGHKYLLRTKPSNDVKVLELAERHNLSIPISQVLYNRGYEDDEAIRKFLFSSDEDVPKGSLLKDAERAIDRILIAISKKEKILIFGDYDGVVVIPNSIENEILKKALEIADLEKRIKEDMLRGIPIKIILERYGEF